MLAYLSEVNQAVINLAVCSAVYVPSGADNIIVWHENRNILGFAAWRAAADEAELLAIASDSKHRRYGIGSRLLTAVLRQWQLFGVTQGFLEVRENNIAAQTLYRRAGFVNAGIRKNYYVNPDNSRENAIIMKTQIDKESK